MSYEIVKSIKIQDGKVFLHSTANNVQPYDWRTWECTYFSNILQNEGQEALDKTILIEYWNGNMQRSNNNYQKAVDTFDNSVYNYTYTSIYSDELSKLDKELAITESEKRINEVKEKLYQHYINFINRKKEKWYVKYQSYYLHKVTSTRFKFSPHKREAKIFDSRLLAERAVNCATNKELYTFHQVD